MFYNEYILEILNKLIQFTLFLMGKFNSKVELPLGTDCVRLSRVHCTWLCLKIRMQDEITI